MSETLLDTTRRTYEDMWACDQYAAMSPGAQYVPVFRDMTQAESFSPILDAGCGSGKGLLALEAAGFARVRGCDVTDAGLLPQARRFVFHTQCLWEPMQGEMVDWVYCTDVLEHIPVAFTMLVVSRLLEVSLMGVFLSISFVPDAMGHWIGKPLHETVMPFVWWRDQLATVGELVEARDLLQGGAFLVRAR
jgi:SAM-dependent methyltransferase